MSDAHVSTDPISIPWDEAVLEAKATDVIEDMQERFTSGNAVPVERAFIRATEWAALLAWINQLIAEAPHAANEFRPESAAPGAAVASGSGEAGSQAGEEARHGQTLSQGEGQTQGYPLAQRLTPEETTSSISGSGTSVLGGKQP